MTSTPLSFSCSERASERLASTDSLTRSVSEGECSKTLRIRSPVKRSLSLTLRVSGSVVVIDTGLRLLRDEFVAAFALSLADMHLSPALRTGLSPRGRSRVEYHRLVRFLRLQLFHPLFIRLRLSTLRMNSRDRIRNLATNRANFACRSRVHRTGFFLIHGNLPGEFSDRRAWYQPGNRVSIRLAIARRTSLKGPRSGRLVTSHQSSRDSRHARR